MDTRKTESAGGVVRNKGKILVVSQHGKTWSLPKGHIDPGEDALTAAKREILEESGVQNLILIKSLGQYSRYRIDLNGQDDKSEYKTIHMFLFDTDEVNLNPQDPDNPEARWIEAKEVPSLLSHPLDKAFFHNILKEI